jgi:hypothetical protein
MNALASLHARHPHLVRLASLALLLVLAACNSGDNSGGGGVPGY